MLSKNKIKQITSLSQKKFRDEYGLFVAESTKLVIDLLPAFHCVLLVATADWLNVHTDVSADEIIEVSEDEYKKISNQKTPQGVLAVFRKPAHNFDINDIKTRLVLALDDIQDPGNLGTIIRIADWFGIKHIFCSLQTADAYGNKTVQATMGALARVKVHYVDLVQFLGDISGEMPVYGTFLNGENIYNEKLSEKGIIVMGNEGNGISNPVEKLVTKRLRIPNYPEGQATSESLNVSVATALICGEFRRREIFNS